MNSCAPEFAGRTGNTFASPAWSRFSDADVCTPKARRGPATKGRILHARQLQPFSGKRSDDTPMTEHLHAFFLPTDEDGDGRLGHLILYTPHGFAPEEQRALDAWRKMRGPAGIELNVVWLGVEENLPSARRWRSATPFVPTRHYKERGAKRDHFPRQQLAEMNLREDLARRSLPAPIRVEEMDELRLRGRPLAWRHFRQWRVIGKGRRGSDFGRGFEIEFTEPVSGPLALGYACYFGLGLFVPADTPPPRPA